MRRTLRSIAGLTLALGLVIAAVGCTHVKPYEREQLTKPGMERSEEALAGEFEAHVHDSREAAIGDSSSTGGGCGCN